MSTGSEIQQLRDQLEQQALQTRDALFQLMQVREQLISETNARIEAQVRHIFLNIGFFLSQPCVDGLCNQIFKQTNKYLLHRQERNNCCNKTENCLSI